MPEARSVTIQIADLPASPNDTNRGMSEGARMQRANKVSELRGDAKLLAVNAKNRLPYRDFPWSNVRMTLHFNLRHDRYDPDNLVACVKPYIDGIVDAGIIADDSLRVIREFIPSFTVSGLTSVTFQITSLAEEA